MCQLMHTTSHPRLHSLPCIREEIHHDWEYRYPTHEIDYVVFRAALKWRPIILLFTLCLASDQHLCDQGYVCCAQKWSSYKYFYNLTNASTRGVARHRAGDGGGGGGGRTRYPCFKQYLSQHWQQCCRQSLMTMPFSAKFPWPLRSVCLNLERWFLVIP